MASIVVKPPFDHFTDVDGKPLKNGFIFVGKEGLDPEVNPENVFWDASMLISAPNPARTLDGYVVNNGTAAELFVDGGYSITIRNKNGTLVQSNLVASGTGNDADDVSYNQGSLGSVDRTVGDKLRESVSIVDFGGVNDGTTDSTAAGQAAQIVSDRVYVPEGVFLITSHVDYSKFYGPGSFKMGILEYPAGDIKSALTLTVPTTFGYKELFSTYLPYRRVLAALTISVLAGSHPVDMTDGLNVRYEHPDGNMMTIQGASAATTTLVFDFTGQTAQRLYAIGLDGPYSIKFIDGITFNGNNYSGHADALPTLGDGNAADPIGCKIQNQGAMEFGSDTVFNFFARNGILINEGGYCLAVGVRVTDCGSDAFVASLGSALLAADSSCDTIYGDGYFSNRGGELFCNGATITNILTRFSGSAGDGIVSVEGGKIYCDNATLDDIADEGIFVGTGSVLSGNGIDIGASGTGCGGVSVKVERGGVMIANNLTVENGLSDGVQVIEGGELFAIGLTVNSVTGIGLFVDQGGKAVVPDATIGGIGIGTGSYGVQCLGGEINGVRLDVSHSGLDNIRIEQIGTLVANGLTTTFANGHGLLVVSASLARCSTSTFSDNSGDGINCDNSRVSASSAGEIDRNGGWGALSRGSGIIDLSSTTIGLSNGSGTASPTEDVTSGIADSYIYI